MEGGYQTGDDLSSGSPNSTSLVMLGKLLHFSELVFIYKMGAGEFPGG